jgi:hypothetical protein
MAKMNSQSLVITVSQLLRDSDEAAPILSQEIIAQLEAVISELAGSGVIVEIVQS